MSRGPIPDLPPDRPKIDEVEPFLTTIFERHSEGCCLHIAIVDGNLKRDDLIHCFVTAVRENHFDCAMVATAMLRMSPSQKQRIYKGG